MSIKIDIDGIEDLKAFVDIIRHKNISDKDIQVLIDKLNFSTDDLKKAIETQPKGV